jgi:hypothetical protein
MGGGVWPGAVGVGDDEEVDLRCRCVGWYVGYTSHLCV